MANLTAIQAYCTELLNPADYNDYCPNGLQVEASTEIHRLVSGVTASLALIEAAAAQQADALLVHHGYFWKGEPSPLTGMKGHRIQHLMRSGISLLAYHLPLDGHPTLGNNACLGQQLGLNGQPIAPKSLIWGAELAKPISTETLAERVQQQLQRIPTVINCQKPVKRIAWCTGGAQGYIVQAAAAGYDAYISGEISEQTQHQAQELGISYIAAGHHATERYGVHALGEQLAKQFGIEHIPIEIENPA